ncbi:methyltransferase domain-containing protein [Mucilaginibacter robiniae]|uniref:Methyltransferase domain-containing protein n=1 Tax=Mucilaginibacter robiniae TaxID=2728022 RepID=A0A7L5DWK5_9SPHI|nr:methyltransferase domain-containing protein [Mucilaginibacter robiniae]QJD95472.1 methyltransferase domain-containing protein [Mucilaginibacter robiniae]
MNDDKAVSPFVKRVIKAYHVQHDFAQDKCLDAPSGSGRNTFFLAQYFREVLAVDIDESALHMIAQSGEVTNVRLQTVDLKAPLDVEIASFKFVCIVHFFNVTFLRSLLKAMHTGAFLLIETPACHGENFRTLPTDGEIKELFRETELLVYDFKRCKHSANNEDRGAVKAFLKI